MMAVQYLKRKPFYALLLLATIFIAASFAFKIRELGANLQNMEREIQELEKKSSEITARTHYYDNLLKQMKTLADRYEEQLRHLDFELGGWDYFVGENYA